METANDGAADDTSDVSDGAGNYDIVNSKWIWLIWLIHPISDSCESCKVHTKRINLRKYCKRDFGKSCDILFEF